MTNPKRKDLTLKAAEKKRLRMRACRMRAKEGRGRALTRVPKRSVRAENAVGVMTHMKGTQKYFMRSVVIPRTLRVAEITEEKQTRKMTRRNEKETKKRK